MKQILGGHGNCHLPVQSLEQTTIQCEVLRRLCFEGHRSGQHAGYLPKGLQDRRKLESLRRTGEPLARRNRGQSNGFRRNPKCLDVVRHGFERMINFVTDRVQLTTAGTSCNDEAVKDRRLV